MTTLTYKADHHWRFSPILWGALVVAAVAVYLIFQDGVHLMVRWWQRDEYSHGYLIPLIALYLIWQRSDVLSRIRFDGSWVGPAIITLGLVVGLVGELATIYTVVQYAFLIVLYGAALSLVGPTAFRIIAIPMLILFFMIPLPGFLYNNLSSQLQLISSEIGVAVIRLFGISVYLEGNVIDLGGYRLQVVEACSGLRYLFPLMTLGFIVAYFYRAPLWKRLVIFVSTAPITVLMNSFRIGVIGVTVEYFGEEAAEGFLHDFEGWVVFMACFGVLFVEMWLLLRITGDKRPLSEVFAIDSPQKAQENEDTSARHLPTPFLSSVALLIVAVFGAASLAERQEIIPEREEFVTLPKELGGWRGRVEIMEQIYLDTLKLTDYRIINYTTDTEFVNFYSAYYDSQRKGASIHSPKTCLPGDGWRFNEIETHAVDGVTMGGKPLIVNRVLMTKGDRRQLVYYWFQGRSRIITNEYAAKWFIFWDALFNNRTDGALVRLVTPIREGADAAVADERLQEFTKELSKVLPEYIPG
ncbi:MAG: VPLPA-CTERM-specific exosortase XrtD [Gammaproteobacteria bacterium]|nr:VPLPA-CTERM-specific exosortase XrtD [Gammaproteobacteria bacterium]